MLLLRSALRRRGSRATGPNAARGLQWWQAARLNLDMQRGSRAAPALPARVVVCISIGFLEICGTIAGAAAALRVRIHFVFFRLNHAPILLFLPPPMVAVTNEQTLMTLTGYEHDRKLMPMNPQGFQTTSRNGLRVGLSG